MNVKKILLADTNEDYKELLCLYLDYLNYPAPIQAKDGEETLNKALSERPEVIIMELSLPKKDGFQVVAHLRGNPLTRNTFILAATAMAHPRHREKCLAKGFDAYLAKPFTVWELRDLLQAMPSGDSNTNYP
ncbi:MAG: response regulator [Candidatus Binatia bacterium]